jgi:RNA polymerase sigma-70 factor (ECF subfamily)
MSGAMSRYDEVVFKLDRSFLARLRTRDPEALRLIVDEHARRLYRAARGMGYTREQAEDLTQEVLVTFIESIERFEGRAQISTWLFGILHHKSQERRRTQAREDLHDPIDAVFESQFDARGNWIRPPVAPDRVVTSREVREAIHECLEGLPPLQREVFHLRQVEELAAAEVSKILAQTVTHIGVLFHRARIGLRACLERKGWGSSR